jgi:hypothetical protein
MRKFARDIKKQKKILFSLVIHFFYYIKKMFYENQTIIQETKM